MSMLQTATENASVLAEGPVWDAARQRLRWVDIRRGLILDARLTHDGRLDDLTELALDGTVGMVAPGPQGRWIAANGDDLVELDGGRVTRRIPVLGSDGARRFNDGIPDASGRLLVGTLSLAGPSQTEQLLVVERDGSRRVLDDDLTLANGLGFSPDGALLYSIDTWARRINVRDYDAASGAAGPRRVLLELDEGYPDGMCVDADGYLWVAVWGLGRVHRYSPEGQLVRVVEVPAPHTSSVAFAGPALDVLVITTASDELGADELARFPLSGRLFTLRPGVTGLPVPRWGGFTLEETDHA